MPPPVTPTSPVLVTGGTGFLGSRLVARLRAAGRAVTIVSRRPQPKLSKEGFRVVVGPLHDPAVCAEACRDIGTVFHVAARVGVWGKPADFQRDNVHATLALLAAAKKAGVGQFVYTSTPSVVYNGRDLAGADESLPLTTDCPSPYPLTKARAERAVLAANTDGFSTVALRPHLIWGVGDPHLVPRVLARARSGRLRIVGEGTNRVDMVHVDNAVDAHLDAERALLSRQRTVDTARGARPAGCAYFITNGEPVVLWAWINALLAALGEPTISKRLSLPAARRMGAICEGVWSALPFLGEPPMTRFIADELAKDHWFSIEAARRDLGYQPRVTMAAGTDELVAWYQQQRRQPSR
ncbi:MAG TPA: NAD-dependent epimerase/dehydratase family protein [Opitutaceae bacterium]